MNVRMKQPDEYTTKILEIRVSLLFSEHERELIRYTKDEAADKGTGTVRNHFTKRLDFVVNEIRDIQDFFDA